MIGEVIKFPDKSNKQSLAIGSAGLKSQATGQPTTVSALAEMTGGIRPGALVERDITNRVYINNHN